MVGGKAPKVTLMPGQGGGGKERGLRSEEGGAEGTADGLQLTANSRRGTKGTKAEARGLKLEARSAEGDPEAERVVAEAEREVEEVRKRTGLLENEEGGLKLPKVKLPIEITNPIRAYATRMDRYLRARGVDTPGNPTSTRDALGMLKRATGMNAREIRDIAFKDWKVPTVEERSTAPKDAEFEVAREKMLMAISHSRLVRDEMTVQQSEARGARLAKFERSLKSKLATGKMTESDYLWALHEMRGPLTERPQLEGIRDMLTNAEYNVLLRAIVSYKGFNGWDVLGATHGFKALVEGGVPLAPSVSEKLVRVFGPELVTELAKKRSVGDKVWDEVMGIANMPRTFMTFCDHSAVLGQAAISTMAHPLDASKAFAASVRMGFPALMARGQQRLALTAGKARYEAERAEGKGVGEALWHGMRAGQWELRSKDFEALFDYVMPQSEFYHAIRNVMKVSLTDPRGSNPMAREEMYTSRVLQNIPGLGMLFRTSERLYAGYLTWMRWSQAENWLRAQQSLNKLDIHAAPGTEDAVRMETMGQVIDWASGRGRWPKRLEGLSTAANMFGFAPRYALARGQTAVFPLYWASLRHKSPEAARRAAADLMKMTAVGLSILFIARARGAKVDFNPLSPDFLQVREGELRREIFGGASRYVRSLVQFILGKRKDPNTGVVVPLGRRNVYKDRTRYDVAIDFLGGKLAPQWGIIRDWAKGEMYGGEPFTPGNVWKQYGIPMLAQDIWQGAESAGLGRALNVGLTSTFGINATWVKPRRRKLRLL
jgi:hypothetical protein